MSTSPGGTGSPRPGADVRGPLIAAVRARMAALARGLRHHGPRVEGGARSASVRAARLLRRAAIALAHRTRSAWSHRSIRIGAAVTAAVLLSPPTWVVYHVYWNRSGLPDIDAFIRFEPPTIGEIYDARGTVLI